MTGTKVKRELKRTPFVSTYCRDSGRISNILRKHWSILQGCPNIDEFKQLPLMSDRRAPNLRDKLVKSDVGSKKKLGVKCLDQQRLEISP